jgi:DNA-binding NarL/FixJ family response regulator/tetratricopeptide (TPR) repeat protein
MAATASAQGLYGREAEVKELDLALERAASGQRAILLLEGEAGIGKTRLLAEALDRARSRGCAVALAQAEELEGSRPFGVIAEALGCDRSSPDPRRTAIAALLSAHGAGDLGPITVSSDSGLRFRVLDALTDLAEELALDRPLVIGLDDLQWADPSSLLTVAAIGRRLAHLPVALIACFRPSPRSADLQRVIDSLEGSGARHFTLSRLTDRAVSRLVAEIVDAEPGPRLLAEMAGAAGNPLFVTELAGAILQEGILQTEGGHAEVAEMILPPSLRLTILRRLDFLAGGTLRALQSASILGSSFTVIDLSAVTGSTAASLSEALAEALRAGVLADDGSRLRFRHELIRDTIYLDLPASVRDALHREAGQRLADSGAPALQVAEQLARGAVPGDAGAVSWLTRAAREAAPRSPETAAAMLERAIGLTGPADPGRDGLIAERAVTLMLAGKIGDAQAACLSLLDREHDPGVDGEVRICLGQALLAQGRMHDGLRELAKAADSPALTQAERARTQAWAGFAQFSLGDLAGAAAMARQARAAAAECGDHVTTSIAMTILAVVSESRGRLREALQIIDEAVALANDSPGRQGHRYPVHVTRGHILIELDRLQDAKSTLQTGLRISEELGVRWAAASYHAFLAMVGFTAGDWDDASAELEASIELAAETDRDSSLILSHSLLSIIRLHRNDLHGAAESVAPAARLLAATGSRYRSHWAIWARALVAEADGDSARAYADLERVWDQCAQSGLALEYPVLGPDLIRLALATGHGGRARDIAAAVAGVAAGNDVASLTGAALRCRGLADDDAGMLRRAVDAYARGPRPLELALACEEAGRALARQGTAASAIHLLDQAAEGYHRLGATRDHARVQAALRGLGVRRGRRGTRTRPQHGWQSLTPAEQAIAILVAEGLSNPRIGERLFVSHRTVQTHIAHLFAKLGVASRAQLAAEVTRHRGNEPTRQ